jgi:diaminopimelate epimerase
MKFGKYEGAGNDFILIDDREEKFPFHCTEFIQRLCHRHFGIGADGLILVQNDAVADVRMRIFNADGGEADGCGNGMRCVVRFLSDVGWEERPRRVAVGDRILTAYYTNTGIAIEMGPIRNLRLHIDVDGTTVHLVDTGVPHAVCFERVQLETFGPQIRYHAHFAPAGVNVNVVDPQSCTMRTYERGVEGETLACGTGATAVAVVGALLYGWKSPVSLQCRGGILKVHFDRECSNLILEGPARAVFWGHLCQDPN